MTRLQRFLLWFDGLIGCLAFGSGIALAITDGLGLPPGTLTSSPFSSYFWPGMILTFVVGGSHLLAAMMTVVSSRYAPEFLAVAGFGLLIWVMMEVFMIPERSWMQLIFFAASLVTLIATMRLIDTDSGRHGGGHAAR